MLLCDVDAVLAAEQCMLAHLRQLCSGAQSLCSGAQLILLYDLHVVSTLRYSCCIAAVCLLAMLPTRQGLFWSHHQGTKNHHLAALLGVHTLHELRAVGVKNVALAVLVAWTIQSC